MRTGVDASEQYHAGHARAASRTRAVHRRHRQGQQGLTGGGLKPATGQFEGAYVVRCASLVEAREIAGSDQLVRASMIRCEVPEWELIGINVSAVDRDALLHPQLG